MTEFLARRRTEAKPKPILIVRSLEPFKARAKQNKEAQELSAANLCTAPIAPG